MILVDTHVVLWLAQDDKALGQVARRMIADALAEGALAASAITFWEIALLLQKRRLQLDVSPEAARAAFLAAGGIEVPLDGEAALLSTELTGLPADPADRFIVATAVARGATLMTADRPLLRWRHPLPRQDARR